MEDVAPTWSLPMSASSSPAPATSSPRAAARGAPGPSRPAGRAGGASPSGGASAGGGGEPPGAPGPGADMPRLESVRAGQLRGIYYQFYSYFVVFQDVQQFKIKT